jgi:hypothetical protein
MPWPIAPTNEFMVSEFQCLNSRVSEFLVREVSVSHLGRVDWFAGQDDWRRTRATLAQCANPASAAILVR